MKKFLFALGDRHRSRPKGKAIAAIPRCKQQHHRRLLHRLFEELALPR
jgi:hypothetical protein